MVETFGPTDDEWAVFTSHGNWHGVRQGAEGPQGARGRSFSLEDLSHDSPQFPQQPLLQTEVPGSLAATECLLV